MEIKIRFQLLTNNKKNEKRITVTSKHNSG